MTNQQRIDMIKDNIGEAEQRMLRGEITKKTFAALKRDCRKRIVEIKKTKTKRSVD